MSVESQFIFVHIIYVYMFCHTKVVSFYCKIWQLQKIDFRINTYFSFSLHKWHKFLHLAFFFLHRLIVIQVYLIVHLGTYIYTLYSLNISVQKFTLIGVVWTITSFGVEIHSKSVIFHSKIVIFNCFEDFCIPIKIGVKFQSNLGVKF